ncbi:MAG TPA: hypothetical protein VIP11_14665, partial [Gemmatimonadaceae bacterium]
AAPNEAYVAGGVASGIVLTQNATGTVWRYDGRSWSATQSPLPQAKVELQCPAPGQTFVIANGSAFMRYSGTAWTPMSGIGTAARLLQWGIVSPNEIYFYGDSATESRAYYSYNGTTGREVGRSSFVQGSVIQTLEMWADPRGGSAYHVGPFGRLERVTSANHQVLSYQPSLRDVMFTSPTSAFAVGWNLFLARWNGTTWTIDRPPSGTISVRILAGVWSDGPNNAWTVGNASTILRWNGSAWSVVSDQVRPIVSPIDNYNSVWGSGSTVWIAGNASMLRCTSPTACANASVPGSGILYGIWGTTPTNVFAVGASGRILRYNGTAWSQMTSPTTRTLTRVWGSSASDVWAVGDSVVVHWDGTLWKDVPMTGDLATVRSSAPSPLQGIFQLGLWGSGPRDVYIGGDNGRIVRFDGATWRAMPTSTAHRIVSISGVPGFGAIALTEPQSNVDGAILLRGIGPSGGLSATMTPPAVWP